MAAINSFRNYLCRALIKELQLIMMTIMTIKFWSSHGDWRSVVFTDDQLVSMELQFNVPETLSLHRQGWWRDLHDFRCTFYCLIAFHVLVSERASRDSGLGQAVSHASGANDNIIPDDGSIFTLQNVELIKSYM